MMDSGMQLFTWSRRDFIVAALAASYGAARAAAGGSPPVILVVGDSLSAEYGLKRGTGWVALLERRLAKEKVAARVVNASISGDTTSGGRSRLAMLLQQHKPTHVVIELGGNDALRGLPLAMTEDNLSKMTEAAQKAGARVLLVGMQVPPNYGADYGNRFSGLFAKVAKQYKTGLVPFLLQGVADGAEPTRLFQADRIHPREEAHPMMLDNVWPELRKLLLAGAEPPQAGQAPRGGRAKPVGVPDS
jgi:acyl-CoA thioesterase I